MLTLSSVTTRTNTPAAGSPTAAAYPPDVLDVAVEQVKMAESRVLLIMTGSLKHFRPSGEVLILGYFLGGTICMVRGPNGYVPVCAYPRYRDSTPRSVLILAVHRPLGSWILASSRSPVSMTDHLPKKSPSLSVTVTSRCLRPYVLHHPSIPVASVSRPSSSPRCSTAPVSTPRDGGKSREL